MNDFMDVLSLLESKISGGKPNCTQPFFSIVEESITFCSTYVRTQTKITVYGCHGEYLSPNNAVNFAS